MNPKGENKKSHVSNGKSSEEILANELDHYINLYKGKKIKMEEFLQNLLFNLNYIQYKLLELQYVINE